jgi:hypothetical protein
MDEQMKTPMTKIHTTADSIEEDPFISFSHLASCFSEHETVDDNPNPSHGFPSPREENLYETGILVKMFLKC